MTTGSTPSGMSIDTLETYLRNGHAEWYNNTNWCGIADNSSFLMAYGGRTTTGWGDNGVNTVDFGSNDVCGSSIAAACTRTEIPNNVVAESDTRFNWLLIWVNGQAAGAYDTWSMMAHELGHTLGFGHVPSTSNVMYGTKSPNTIADEKLGKGDANGNNAKY